MKVTFLGTGTSQGVPVIACDCMVCLSPDARDKRLRSSIMLEFNQKTVVIDTGPDFRQQMLACHVKKLDAVIFTHEHKDHMAGLDDVRAFNYIHNKAVDIYLSARVEKAIRREYAYIFEDLSYPGIPQIELFQIENKPFTLFEKLIIPIEVRHFKLPVFGYRIDDFCYITDAKSIDEIELEKLKGLKYLVLNALRKEPHVSHLTLDEAIALIEKLQPKKAFLTHISHQLGLQANIERALPGNISLAYDGLSIEI